MAFFATEHTMACWSRLVLLLVILQQGNRSLTSSLPMHSNVTVIACLLHGIGDCQCPQTFTLTVSGVTSFVVFDQPACFLCQTNDNYTILGMTLMSSPNIMIFPDNTLRVVDPSMLFSNTADTTLRCGTRLTTVKKLGELIAVCSLSLFPDYPLVVLLSSVQPPSHHSCEPSGCGGGDGPDTHL